MTKDMTEGKPFGLLVGFALPMIASGAFQIFYNIADSIVVGRMIGVEAFAAVSAAGFFYWLTFSIVLGFTQGFGIFLAQRFGAKDFVSLRRAFSASMILSLILGAALSAVCFAIAGPVLAVMGTPLEIINDSAAYLRLMCAGLIVTFVFNTLANLFRATGDSKTPVYALVTSSIVNVVLDVVIVKYTPLGLQAIAVATIIAQLLSLAFCAWRFFKLPKEISAKSDIRFDAVTARELMRLGGPIGFRNMVISIGGVVVQYYINGYGTVFIAGLAAPKSLYSLMNIVCYGMDAATATYVAQNYGAKKLDRIKDGVKISRNVLLCGAGAIMVLCFAFGRSLLGLYIAGESAMVSEVMDVAVLELNLMLAFLPLLYMLFLYRSALQGLGNAFIPMFSGFVELAARIFCVAVMPVFIGQWGVYLAEPIAWPFTAALLYVSYKKVYKRKIKEAIAAGELLPEQGV